SEPRADGAAEERAEDGDAALPDEQHGPGVLVLAEVEARVGEDVEDARADDRERHGEQADVDDDPRLAAALGQAVVREERRDDDPREDAQRVEVDRQRADLEAADRRARDAGDDGERGESHAASLLRPAPSPTRPGSPRRAAGGAARGEDGQR